MKINWQFYPLKLYFRDLANIILIGLSLLANIFSWFWLLFNISYQDKPIFLHYNILFGVDSIGSWWGILLLPLLGLGIIIVNIVIGWLSFGKDKFMAHILNCAAFLCQIILLCASFVLVFLNI